MMHFRLRIDLKCPRHPRFNPKHGPGAVKGGCIVCFELAALFCAADSLRVRAVLFRGAYPQGDKSANRNDV